MSDEGLRQAYARALARRAPAERAACPAPEALLALVRREGTEEQRLSLLDHAMACPACGNEFELLRAIDRAGEQAAREETGSARGEDKAEPGRVVGHIGWRRWAPLAAAAVVLLFALGPGRRLWQPAPETVRGGGEPLGLVAPADASTPPNGSVTFVWHPAPQAERYTLEVLTSGGAVAYRSATPDTTATLAPATVLPPGDYRWWVVATAGDGSETRSVMRTLRLRGR